MGKSKKYDFDSYIGKTFNNLTVIEKMSNGRWRCLCSCGKEKIYKAIYDLIRGHTISCGCKKSERISKINTTDVIEKRKQTNIRKYGGVAPACSDTIKNKMKNTNMERYGGIAPACSNKIIKKIEQTCLNKYGTSNVMKIDEFKIKAIKNREWEDLYTLPNGKYLVDYCREKNILPTSARHVMYKHGEKVMLNWLESYTGHTSSLEIAFSELISNYNLSIKQFNREVFELAEKGIKYRPDFKLNDKVYVDIDGLFVHSQAKRTYHFDKRKAYENAGLKLIQIREDELKLKKEAVVSLLSHLAGNSNRLGARETEVKEIDFKTANDFMDTNHLMGKASTSKAIALFNSNNEPVSVLMYKKYKDGLDISRYANKIGTTVVGGLSKLISHLIDKEHPSFIQSFVDLRYGSGNSLEKIGFKRIHDTLGWKWTDSVMTFNRRKCRANMDERHLPEKQYADELGWYKIYDAGQRLFILSLK